MSDACNVLIPSAYEDIVSVVDGIKKGRHSKLSTAFVGCKGEGGEGVLTIMECWHIGSAGTY